MTEPLRPELEELLPCSGSSPQCDAHDPARCTPCRERPAILAWVQRKLDEAKADAELLEECSGLNDVSVTYRIGGAVYFECAPTLREALRKLVGDGS